MINTVCCRRGSCADRKHALLCYIICSIIDRHYKTHPHLTACMQKSHDASSCMKLQKNTCVMCTFYTTSCVHKIRTREWKFHLSIPGLTCSFRLSRTKLCTWSCSLSFSTSFLSMCTSSSFFCTAIWACSNLSTAAEKRASTSAKTADACSRVPVDSWVFSSYMHVQSIGVYIHLQWSQAKKY